MLLATAQGGATTSTATAAGAGDARGAKPEGQKDKEKEERERDTSENPTIMLEGFSTQITRDGVPTQEITAGWALMDEKEQILDLRNLRSVIYASGEKAGEAVAGSGRVWLKDRKKEQINRHDVSFGDGVRYVMKEGWILETPRMRYSSKSTLLTSDAGYVKQLPTRQGYMIGRGQRFEIKLDMEKKTFEHWYEYGQPAVLVKSEKPELKP